MTRAAFAVAVLALAVVVAVLALYATRAERPAVSPSPAVPVSASPTPTTAAASPTATAPPTVSTPTVVPAGSVTGALGYPSEFIPPLTVYAISVADQRVFFSLDTPRYPLATNTPPRPTYTMTGVAPGTYYVLAYRNDDVNVEAKNSPGVHSQYVLQCLQPNAAGSTPAPGCSSGDHSPVPVTVRAGETIQRIDVTDWYYGAVRPSYPPRPR